MNVKDLDRLISKLEVEAEKTRADSEVFGRLDRLKEQAATYKGEDEVVSFEEVVQRVKTQEEAFKIMTGWENFDKIIQGFRPQQVVVVSALTKSGKTQWCMDLTARIGAYSPLWLPFEESAEELLRKCVERGVEPPRGFTPNIMRGGELSWVESKIVEGIVKYDSKIVFIDHLDFLVPFGADNHALRVAETMRTIKGFAKKWGVCIVLICHLTKVKMDTVPTLEDLRGSSAIGQEADTAIILWRETKRSRTEVTVTNNTIVSIQANRRHGSTGNVTMVYDGKVYREEEWREDIINSDRVNNDFINFGKTS